MHTITWFSRTERRRDVTPRRRGSGFVAVALAMALAPVAQAAPMPEILYSQPEEKTLITHERRPMTVRPYSPPFVVEPAPQRSDSSYATPERLVASWLGGIEARDRVWVEEAFEPESRDEIPPAGSERAEAELDLLGLVFADKRVVLHHQLEFDGHRLVTVSSTDPTSGERFYWQAFLLVEHDDRWWIRDQPLEPFFARLGDDWDPEAAELLIDLGTVLRSPRP